MVADDTGEVAKKLGLIHPGQGTNTVRAVFIVDPEGTVRRSFITRKNWVGTWMRSYGWSKATGATENGVLCPLIGPTTN